MGRKDNIIVGLDIGTTKVCAIVGEVNDNRLDIVGVGTAPSKGLRKGAVVHIEGTVESIRRAIEEAELMAGCEINEVYTGIGGGHIQSFNSHGIVAVKDREVRAEDVQRVIDAARAVAIPMDREVIHVIPQEFIVDDQEGVRDPLGMTGVRLEARVHIVTAPVTSTQNIVRSCHQAGVQVADIGLQQLASADAVLSNDEKELGVALVDIGGGTTDICIFQEGSILDTEVLGLGGHHLTADIAQGLRTPREEAERLKHKFGCALTSLVAADEAMEVPSVGGRAPRTLSRQVLAEIIEARMEEILLLVRRELDVAGVLDGLHSGIVLTGGAAMLRGITELAEDIFELEIRRGSPEGVGGLSNVVKSPKFATAVGLTLYGARHLISEGPSPRSPRGGGRGPGETGIYKRIRHRVASWFGEVF